MVLRPAYTQSDAFRSTSQILLVRNLSTMIIRELSVVCRCPGENITSSTSCSRLQPMDVGLLIAGRSGERGLSGVPTGEHLVSIGIKLVTATQA